MSVLSPKSALIFGATGQAGRHLLQSLLASPHFSRVGEYGRKVTSPSDIKTGKDKLEQKVIDFEKIQEYGLKQGKWDVVFITLGTNKSTAGSAEAFEKIDREYVVNAAQEARNVELATQRIIYLSSTGANSSSPLLYPRSKGLTEEALASIGYSDTIIFRPGLLAGVHRQEPRYAEAILGKLTSQLSYVSSSVEIQVSTLGQAMCNAGISGSQALPKEAGAMQTGKEDAKYTVILNAGAIKLAERKE